MDNQFVNLVRRVFVGTAVVVGLSACGLLQPEKVGQTAGKEYTVTIKNTLKSERLDRKSVV